MDIGLLKTQIKEEIQKVNSQEALEEFRLKYLGRKGVLAQLTGSIPTLPPQERGEFGRNVNILKGELLSVIEERHKSISTKQQEEAKAFVDISMPGISCNPGHLHIITQTINEICAVFNNMGFAIVEGPELETEFNNFTGLNIPLEHPSRDVFDTFYIKHKDKLLLRSHTSPVQIRVMKSEKPPFAIVVPGRVYRPDAVDASHSFMFHQIEGFLVDKNIKFSDLKGMLEIFAKEIFSKDIKMRFRPHFFPFTEPSAEVDVSCIICGGRQAAKIPSHQKNCPVCHGKGWLEILGSGMIHPNVLKNVGIDSKKYSGFAFGMGVERVAMLKYGINDIRAFFENDLRFLRQF